MSNRIVVNELLAFLQQKLDVMDEVSALQICATNFSEDEIATAKLLLFEALNKRDKMVSRRRDGTKKSIQDIITLFKETDPDDVPTFVAKDLNKLPPVTFDHVDVTSLLKDIILLKKSLKEVHEKLDASENTVSVLRKELDELRNSAAVSRSPTLAVTHGDLPRASSFVSAVSSPLQPSNASTVECAPRVPRPAAPPCPAARTQRSVPLPMPVAPAKPSFATITAKASAAPTSSMKPFTTTKEDDEFVTVQRRKRRSRTSKNHCGTAPDTILGVRAAMPNTPVYLSRLHFNVEAKNIEEYVRLKLNHSLRVQMLESRRNVNFRAFVVRVPNCYLHLVMEENFWPKGVVFRRFRGTIPPERTKT